jgi:hypothetical protein
MPSSSPSPTPLALTDDQLDQIMRAAEPLHPRVRRLFVERVAHELRGQTIGDGVVYLACRRLLKESGVFNAPELDSGCMPRISKWDR